MIITHLKGGLGNQMFQYATGYALAKDFNSINKLDVSHFSILQKDQTKREFELDNFNISSAIATKEETKQISRNKNKPVLSNILNKTNYFLLTANIVDYPIQKYLGIKNLYLNGYFQNEKHFIKYREDILNEFSLKNNFQTKEYLEIANRIKSEKKSVSIHVRRGDYITNSKARKHHGVLNKEYYIKALKLLQGKYQQIYIFSDEIDWVKRNYKFLPENCYFVSKHKFNSAQEIKLMSFCKHNIIANSSFSWWGAWLNDNKNKIVVAPYNWTVANKITNKKIIPSTWIKIL